MKHSLLYLILALFISACNTSNQKEAELLKKENEFLKKELEKKKNEISSNIQENHTIPIQISNSTKEEIISADIKTLFNMLNGGFGSSSFDSKGNFSIDTGAASTGRVKGNLKNVNLSIEYLPVRPGCADICPEMAVIHFKCKFGSNCILDPNMLDYGGGNSGAISYEGLDTGKKVFELLARIQKNL